MPKLEDYKGHVITVETDGTFHAVRDSTTVATANTLDELRKMVDRLLKAKMNIPCYHATADVIVEGRVTSVQQKRWGYEYHTEFRVTFERGKEHGWEDRRADRIIKHTAENEKLIQEHNELVTKSKQLMEKAREIAERLERFKQEELLPP